MLVAITAVCKILVVCKIYLFKSVAEGVALPEETCGDGYFFSDKLLRCTPCSKCEGISTIVLTPCTASADTVCRTCTQEELVNNVDCRRCAPCKPGEFMVSICTENFTTICAPCPLGSFNADTSYKTHCLPCRDCGRREVVRHCTASVDTECGRCKKGYYKDENRNQCYKCHTCMPGQPVLEGCRGGIEGKLCGPHIFYKMNYLALAEPKGADDDFISSTQQTHTTSHDFSSSITTTSSTDHTLSYRTRVTVFTVTAFIMLYVACMLVACKVKAHHCKSYDVHARYSRMKSPRVESFCLIEIGDNTMNENHVRSKDNAYHLSPPHTSSSDPSAKPGSPRPIPARPCDIITVTSTRKKLHTLKFILASLMEPLHYCMMPLETASTNSLIKPDTQFGKTQVDRAGETIYL